MILTLKSVPDCEVNMRPVTPASCLGHKPAEIANISLQTTAGICALGNLFDISSDEAERLIIRNAAATLNNVGIDLNDGEMVVEGNVGNWAAYRMSGGKLTITGSVGNYAAGAMSAGSVNIGSNAGDSLGGAATGSPRGMRGGTVMVQGNSGDCCGDRMRNGLLIVKGNAGAYCAARMIAGSIIVLGKVGTQTGFNMRRGSLFLSHSELNHPPLFFTAPRYHETGFLPLMLKHLHHLDPDFSCWPVSRYAHRCIGDLSLSGLGEIFFI